MNNEINLGIGYIINNNGELLGFTNENYKKSINKKYEEIIKFLLEEYAKSNNMKLKNITFI